MDEEKEEITSPEPTRENPLPTPQVVTEVAQTLGEIKQSRAIKVKTKEFAQLITDEVV